MIAPALVQPLISDHQATTIADYAARLAEQDQFSDEQKRWLIEGVTRAVWLHGVGEDIRFRRTPPFADPTALNAVIAQGITASEHLEKMAEAIRQEPKVFTPHLDGCVLEHSDEGRLIAARRTVENLTERARAMYSSEPRKKFGKAHYDEHAFVRQLAEVYYQVHKRQPAVGNNPQSSRSDPGAPLWRSPFRRFVDYWCDPLGFKKPSEAIARKAIRAWKDKGPWSP